MTGPRVAILGAGMIGAVHRRSALLAGATVVGVMASTPERSATVAREWGVERGFADIDEVLASDVDVVHVCTPNATHVPYALAAVRAGKHVIVEKPLGVSVAQAQSLADAVASAGVVATVPFVYRFHPLVREIRARHLAGEFGRINLVHGSYLQDWMLDPLASSWRVDAAQGGPSRAFADIGSHWCDLVEWVTGERFVELTATTSIAVASRPAAAGASFSAARATGAGASDSAATSPVENSASSASSAVATEDIALTLLRTESGSPASVTVSQVAAGRKNRLWFELDGSAGSAVFDQENPEQVWLGGAEESRVIVRDPGVGSAEQRRLSTQPAGHSQGWGQCFEAFVADSYRAMRGEAVEGLPTVADGLRSAHIVEAMLASSASRAWTPIAND